MMEQAVQFVLFQPIIGSIMKKFLFIFIAILLYSSFVFAQRPPRGEGRPPRGEGRPSIGQPPFPHDKRRGHKEDKHQDRDRNPPWLRLVDFNKNGNIERDEYEIGANIYFKQLDKNNNGIVEESEIPLPMMKPLQLDKLPIFLFLEQGDNNLNKEQFDEKTNLRFIVYDLNADGVIDQNEIAGIKPFNKPAMPNMALAQFVGAEMRFGDKVIKNAPFSAETVRSENKRLFDGTIIKNESKGLIYRDKEGRMRQEQPLESINGYKVVDTENQPIRRINIVDVVSGEYFFLHKESKTASKIPHLPNSPLTPNNESPRAKKESLGTKQIEGVNAEGTRSTIEIPIGQIGNDKPIFVVTEKWFSNELQMIVLSKHTDPFIGEVTFQLINIKLAEPLADLFKVPNDYKIIALPNRKNKNE